jgi:hypothetical protein
MKGCYYDVIRTTFRFLNKTTYEAENLISFGDDVRNSKYSLEPV